jgi:D-glycero-alpha-D-manno-heptose 1-phosphate guanylyltransferase
MSLLTDIPAIVLCGGFGTRLQSVVSDVPKPMALVGGRPFLHYVFCYLKREGVREAILAVGYKREVIEKYFGHEYMGIAIRYSVEQEPLGTGGGIKQAYYMTHGEVFVLNGDTFFDVSLKELSTAHEARKADLTIALKPMQEFDRYGTVSVDENGRIAAFEEKRYCRAGLINGGIYLLGRHLFDGLQLPLKFSFEKEIMEGQTGEKRMAGVAFDSYFIDIGIPEDYSRAQTELPQQAAEQ